jgi:hypothetical protein
MNEIKEILQSSIKGKFIEYHIATPAWYPIISLESSDHEEWKNVKRNFLIFLQKFKILEKQKLSIYIEHNINILLEQKKILDSKNISQITVKSICEYLFDYTLTNEELEYIYIKVLLNGKKKLQLKVNQIYYTFFTEKWDT